MLNRLPILRLLSHYGMPILISLIVCGIGLGIFSLSLVTKTSIDKGEIHHSQSIMDSVHIYRNKFSIPHIVSHNEQDAFIAMGYVHAQDRLWQMDIARRAGRGRLAEIFGEQALQSDRFMRVMNLVDIAGNLLKNSSKTTKQILESYSKGVNLFLEMNPDKVPFEFGALSYTPESWTPEDCLIIMRLMAIEMNMSMWTDLAFGEIADKFGIQSALAMIPKNTPGTVYQYGGTSQEFTSEESTIAQGNLEGLSTIHTSMILSARETF